jgi:SAM-dependent methyltransferase
MNNPTNPFPLLYHKHHQHFCEDLPFWQSLARKQGDPILELGCGTGRVLIPLALAGNFVVGIDNNPDMLAYLNQQIDPDMFQFIQIHEEDITNYNINEKLRLVILPCNTYSTFDSYSRTAILNCTYKHLVPGGLFAVSIPNPTLLMAVDETISEFEVETIFSHPITGHPVQVSSQWRQKGNVISFIWYYDHLFPDGRVERLTSTADHYLASEDQYISEMLTAGFIIQSKYGNFESDPYKTNSNYLIILMSK